MNLGLFLGLAMILSTTLAYAVDLGLFTNWMFSVAVFAIVIGFGTVSAVRNKKSAGGFLSFKDTFVSYFITILIGLVISTLFTIILFNFIDPDAKAVITEQVIKTTVTMLQNFGTPASEINKAVKDMQSTDSFSALSQLQGVLVQIVLYSIAGLIVSLIVRRERPQSI